MTPPARLVLTAVALLPLAGCGGGDLEKVTVEGVVTFDGKPINNGDILFAPTGNTQGPISGAPIVEGNYKVVNKGGVPVGTHEVRIRGYLIDEQARRALEADPDAIVGRTQYVPDKYNEKSGLSFRVESGSSRVTKNFDLTK